MSVQSGECERSRKKNFEKKQENLFDSFKALLHTFDTRITNGLPWMASISSQIWNTIDTDNGKEETSLFTEVSECCCLFEGLMQGSCLDASSSHAECTSLQKPSTCVIRGDSGLMKSVNSSFIAIRCLLMVSCTYGPSHPQNSALCLNTDSIVSCYPRNLKNRKWRHLISFTEE